MKKTVSILLFVILTACLFASCRQQDYLLTNSQMDSVIDIPTDFSNKKRPARSQITGVYYIEGNDEHSDYNAWRAYVSDQGGKVLIQVYLPQSSPKTVTEQILERVTSEYDPATGRFEQTYVADEYTSVYEAYFSIEKGKIKIDMQNVFFYHNDGVLYTGLKAIGYKE